jgi:uncharacterized protein with NRDE domain
MCLILFAHRIHPDFPLILAANRDEFYDRPTAPARFWTDAPKILAGRDLLHGGTWLGITRGGRLAVVSNFRDPDEAEGGKKSRGQLVTKFLQGETLPEPYLHKVSGQKNAYRGFNLLVGTPGELWYYSNREDKIRPLGAGLYGLSNHLLDTPWPKVVRVKKALSRLLRANGPIEPEDLFSIMTDTRTPPDSDLPDTGVGLERERLLSPPFIASSVYGTRSTTVLLFRSNRKITFLERSFDISPERWQEVHQCFTPGPEKKGADRPG